MTKLLCTTADGDMQIVRIEESEEWQRDWGRAVVGAALADPTKLSAHRDKMVLFSSRLLLFALRISVVPVAFWRFACPLGTSTYSRRIVPVEGSGF
jgi:hypothetical protein